MKPALVTLWTGVSTGFNAGKHLLTLQRIESLLLAQAARNWVISVLSVSMKQNMADVGGITLPFIDVSELLTGSL
jgi:hypothetical protein